MEYISLKYIQEFVAYSSEEELFVNKEKLILDLEVKFQIHLFLEQGKNRFTKDEVIGFIKNNHSKSVLVFDQWILASKSLKSLLIEGKLIANDIPEKLNEHFLFREFCAFISPFLLPKLLLVDSERNTEIASYISILNSDGQMILQDKISRRISEEWDVLEKIDSQEEFNQLAKNVFSAEKIKTLNYFTKHFYAQKVSFIEKALDLFKNPLATYPFVLWLTNQLNTLELNPEHKERLNEVSLSLKSGDGKYFTPNNKIKTFSINRLIVLIFVITAFAVGFWFLRDSFTDNKNTLADTNKSSFSQFSKKERIQLDSLIQSMEGKRLEDEDVIDQQKSYLHLAPVDVTISSRESLKNTLAEIYVQDCIKAFDLAESSQIDSCAIYSDKQIKNLNFAPLKNLKLNAGTKELFLKNESNYMVQILVFDEISNATVYSIFLASQHEFKCKIKIGQKIIFIPGENLGKVILPKKANLSENYKHHFCFMDGNFISNVMNAYTIQSVAEEELKLLLNDNEEKGFYIVDLFQALK
ncbi:MAG: hypothetical protein ACK5B9_12040 [Flavobacteriia bacterium]|jgi:hypothetical protein